MVGRVHKLEIFSVLLMWGKKSCGAQEGKSLGTFSLSQQGQDDVEKKGRGGEIT